MLTFHLRGPHAISAAIECLSSDAIQWHMNACQNPGGTLLQRDKIPQELYCEDGGGSESRSGWWGGGGLDGRWKIGAVW